MAAAILRYFLNDLDSEKRNCWEFCRSIFDEILPGPFIQLNDEIEFKVGDPVVLLKKAERELTVKHYALALGEGYFISKFGNGGMIFITDLKSMMEYWDCRVFGTMYPNPDPRNEQAFPTFSWAD